MEAARLWKINNICFRKRVIWYVCSLFILLNSVFNYWISIQHMGGFTWMILLFFVARDEWCRFHFLFTWSNGESQSIFRFLLAKILLMISNLKLKTSKIHFNWYRTLIRFFLNYYLKDLSHILCSCDRFNKLAESRIKSKDYLIIYCEEYGSFDADSYYRAYLTCRSVESP